MNTNREIALEIEDKWFECIFEGCEEDSDIADKALVDESQWYIIPLCLKHSIIWRTEQVPPGQRTKRGWLYHPTKGFQTENKN